MTNHITHPIWYLEPLVWIGAAPTGPNPKAQHKSQAKRPAPEEKTSELEDNSNATTKRNLVFPKQSHAKRVPKQVVSETQDDDSNKEGGNCAYSARWQKHSFTDFPQYPFQPNVLNENISDILMRICTSAWQKVENRWLKQTMRRRGPIRKNERWSNHCYQSSHYMFTVIASLPPRPPSQKAKDVQIGDEDLDYNELEHK